MSKQSLQSPKLKKSQIYDLTDHGVKWLILQSIKNLTKVWKSDFLCYVFKMYPWVRLLNEGEFFVFLILTLFKTSL